MPRKKKPSLLKIISRVFILSIWGVLITIIPAAIAIYQFVIENKTMIANIPWWTWLTITVVVLVMSIVIGVLRYQQELKRSNQSKREAGKHRSKKIQLEHRGIGDIYTAEKIEIHHETSQKDGIEDSRKETFQAIDKPVLYSGTPEILSCQFSGVLVDTGIQYRPHMVLAAFYNEPAKVRKDSIAEKVRADVSYYGMDMNNILDTRGQWSLGGEWENPSHDHYPRRIKRDSQPLQAYSEVDLRPDGEVQSICLAIRHCGERITYAISPESFDFEYLQHPLYALKEKRYYIHVVLRPQNSEGIENWYVFTNSNYLYIQEIEKPRVLLYPLPRENGKYVSLKVINTDQDEPVFCKAIVRKMERFEQDPTRINGGEWITVNTDENGPLSWHHSGTDSEGYKIVHVNPEFINVAKISEDMNHLIRGNFIFTFINEKPYRLARYKIWIDVICKTGNGFKKEAWIGCIDMVDPMRQNDLTIEECEDVEDWKVEQTKENLIRTRFANC